MFLQLRAVAVKTEVVEMSQLSERKIFVHNVTLMYFLILRNVLASPSLKCYNFFLIFMLFF